MYRCADTKIPFFAIKKMNFLVSYSFNIHLKIYSKTISHLKHGDHKTTFTSPVRQSANTSGEYRLVSNHVFGD